MIIKEQIEKELSQKIEIIKSYDDFMIFNCEDGIQRSNKIINGKHKKKSIRIW